MLTVRPASGPSTPAPVVGSQIRTTPSPPRAEEVERRLLLAKGARRDHWRVTVKVTWTDGTEGRSQRLDKPVDPRPRLRLPRDGTAVSPVLGASLRRRAALTGDRCRQVPQMVTQAPQSVGRSGG
jgi:hypothetical protein